MKIKKLLPVFSYLFHPLFISLYGTLFYFFITDESLDEMTLYLTLIQVIILTVLLPLALFFLFVSIGVLNSFTEASIKERRIPIVIQSFLLLLLLKFSVSLDYIPNLYYFFLGGLISSLVILIALLVKHKTSLHMVGICTLATFKYGLILHYQLPYIYSLAIIIICVGFVASSRLYMKSHTPIELITGSFIGILSQLILWPNWL